MTKADSFLNHFASATGTIPAAMLAPNAWVRLALSSRNDMILIMVTGHKGSAPREKASWMLIDQNQHYGTLGGGQLEFEAIAKAREMLNQGKFQVRLKQDYLLGPDLGQCCGGAVHLLFQPIPTRTNMDQALPWLEIAASKITQAPNQAGYLYFSMDDLEQPPYWHAVASTMDHLHDQALNNGWQHLYVFGAGHVGQAIALTANSLPIHIHLMDQRAEICDQLLLPANASCDDYTPETISKTIPSGAFVVIMTHSHELDYTLGKYLLERDDLSFIGIIGSKTKTARFLKNYRDDGLDDAALHRLTMPLAKAAPAGKEPGLIALGVLHEILTHTI
ncbi:MAG: xanthine dehydrogenase accessory protein XdhC [Alphaproteobacteria bacterium]